MESEGAAAFAIYSRDISGSSVRRQLRDGLKMLGPRSSPIPIVLPDSPTCSCGGKPRTPAYTMHTLLLLLKVIYTGNSRKFIILFPASTKCFRSSCSVSDPAFSAASRPKAKGCAVERHQSSLPQHVCERCCTWVRHV